jgi:hypothetical protein
MPIRNRLGLVARLATLPETRGLIVATVRSPTLRTIGRRAVEDRAALFRDLANSANVRHLARSAIRHPAVAELANAGLVLLPGRYMPLGWAATWAARRMLRRYLDPPVEVREGAPIEAGAAGHDRVTRWIGDRTRRGGPPMIGSVRLGLGRLRRVRVGHRAIRTAPHVADAAIETALAPQATTRLDHSTLLEHTPDPFGDLTSGDHDRLARAALASAGRLP